MLGDIEVERLTYFAGGEACTVDKCAVMRALDVPGVSVGRPPVDHTRGWRNILARSAYETERERGKQTRARKHAPRHSEGATTSERAL
jgi:hypothetical protein